MPINKIIISFEDKGEDYILDKLFKIFPPQGISISQGVEDFLSSKYEKIFSGLC